MKYLILALSILILGCSGNTEKVKTILKADGCTDMKVTGWTFYGAMGCDKHDLFNNSFACLKNGQSVSGYVCSGFFKGFTIRYE